MKKNQLLVVLLTFFLNSFFSLAQETTNTPATPKPGANTLSRQYNAVLEKANTYQDYKVIKQSSLDAFHRSAQDSLATVRKNLKQAQSKITEQQAQLNGLNQTLQGKEKTIQDIQYGNDRIAVLGMQVLKDRYIMTNWIIIGLLAVIATFAFVRYQMSNRVAVAARRDYEEVKQELESYRQKLLESKTALGRELQTERNKIEELYQEIAYLQKQLRSNSGTGTFRHG
jgi:peptidoglycan hydrolase CwlO-like protein